MADFIQAVELVLKHEGGFTPGLPNDPGGATNFGISQRAYPDVDIKNLTVEGAKEIYRRDYWHFDAIEDQQLANCLLDCAVNQGLHAADSMYAPGKTLRGFQLNRLLRYAALNKPQFYHAWFARTLDV